MNYQQFERISREMGQRYGKIKKGEEEKYAAMLFPMESNLLKTWRKHPDSNSRRLDEAILLVLHTVKSRTDSETSDFNKYETDDNKRLKHALLSAFDPVENKEIKDVLEEMGINLLDKDSTYEFFKVPVMCILRIRDSVKHWEKEMGNNGYFRFLEGYLGEKIPNDEEMNYSVLQKSIKTEK